LHALRNRLQLIIFSKSTQYASQGLHVRALTSGGTQVFGAGRFFCLWCHEMNGFSPMIARVLLTTNPRRHWHDHALLLSGHYIFQIIQKSQVYLQLALIRTQLRGTQWFTRCSTWP